MSTERRRIAGPGCPALPESKRRLRTISVYVTDAEYDIIRSSATLASVSMSDYCRAASTGKTLSGRFHRRGLYQLSRIGNNLNQLAYHANATGRLGEWHELRSVLAEIRGFIREHR